MNRLKVNDFSIDWFSNDSHYFFDKSHPEAGRFAALTSKMPFYPGHIYLFTSGFQKIVLLSKQAFLISAEAINRHLKCEKKGRWLIPLPLFHVGGLSVLARAFCGGYVFLHKKDRWQAKAFARSLTEENISYTSLVPAQVYDLVTGNLRPPECLEFALVGGSALAPTIYKKARALGWPLLPTYGMTEVCSQVATASRSCLKKPERPDLKILSHIDIRESQGILEIKSPSLLTGYFDLSLKTFSDPKTKEGWFLTQDKGELVSVAGKGEKSELVHSKASTKQKVRLILKGRSDETIKIKGRLVSLEKFSTKLKQVKERLSLKKDFYLFALPCERKNHELVLVTDSFDFNEVLRVLNQLNKNLPLYEKVVSFYMIKKIPRTGLWKINKTELRKQLLGY